MKKLMFILFFVFILLPPSFSFGMNEEIVLDLSADNSDEIQNNEIKYGRITFDKTQSFNERNNYYQKLLHFEDTEQIPAKKSYSKTIERALNKNASFGGTYSTSVSSGAYNDSLSLFSKLRKKQFALTSSYSQNKLSQMNNYTPGSISFIPEFILNRHISLKNVYTDNLTGKQTKNELVFSLKPFKDDRMDLNLGAGQTYSIDNKPVKSQLNFSTTYRF